MALVIAIIFPVTSASAEMGDEPPAMSIDDVVSDVRSEEPDREALDDAEEQRLTQSMRSALAAEEQGDYEEARDDFVDAYTIFPHSNILLAISRVSRKGGDSERALEGYRRVLERRPDHPDREQLEKIIEEMEEEQRLAEAEAEDEDEREDPFLADLEMPNPSIIGWSGAGVAVVGLVAMIGGAAVASSVNGDFETLDQYRADENRQAYEELSADIEGKQTRGKIFLYGGMGLAVVGIAAATVDYLILDHPPLFGEAAEESRSQWTLGSPEGRGLLIGWSRRF